MKKFKLIGLTGQSGSGKSTVSAIFAEKEGFAVINADMLVSKIYSDASPCLKTISAVFGEDVIKSDGTPDRKLLAQRAFATKENTNLLSRIVHPFVTAEFLNEIKRLDNSIQVLIYDAPQLFESCFDVVCDMIVSVVADKQIRLERICKRDNITQEQAEQRMRVQFDEGFFREKSDYIIENNTDKEFLSEQIEQLVERLLSRGD